ncbi:uncharacterized protein LOC143250538 [Tachypleus tridentatus]|uniref:uncharacterized protein LOC143250538 n=1 Tax=Tachypleus tridentatus TaxID=6853 RepID=UPI003FD45D56
MPSYFAYHWLNKTTFLLLIGGLILTCAQEASASNDKATFLDPSNGDLYSGLYALEPFPRILRQLHPGNRRDLPSFLYTLPGNDAKREDFKRPSYHVMGSEFLGKRSVSEHDNKRMGSEVLGKRMGSEFLGKRMGSEFLGKRMGSEFLGKRLEDFNDNFSEEDDTVVDYKDKRMGSEFLGKRMGSEFLGKRMGSEFLGRRKREMRLLMSSRRSPKEDSSFML